MPGVGRGLRILLLSALLASTASGEEKLLLSFEKAEVARWGKVSELEGGGFEVRRTFRAEPGDATRGQHALVKVIADKYAYLRPGNDTSYYVRTRTGRVLNAFGWLRKAMPQDWSAGEMLRMDVKIEGAWARLCLELEDEAIADPVVREFRVKPGEWTTLEVDLAEAKRQRRLDLRRMATLQLYVAETGQARGTLTVRLDNVRLSAKADPAKFGVLRDARPMAAPSRRPVEPKPLTPLEMKLVPRAAPARPAIVARYPGKASYPLLRCKERCVGGFGASGLLIMDGAGDVRLSVDGGNAWTDLAGKAGAATRITRDIRGHRMTICAGEREIMAAMVPNHCAGGGGRTEMHFYRADYQGGRWVFGPKVVFETGIRHCADRLALLRDAGGRLWIAWDHLNRLGNYAIHAKFSDDDGRTWQSPGANGCIFAFRGMPTGPYLVRDGKHVACFWRQPDGHLQWARFDGKKWSEPVRIGRPFVPISAVNVNGTIYVATARPAQVIRFDGGKWVKDSPPGPGTGLLSRSGRRLVCLWTEPGAEGTPGGRIAFSVKRPGGEWSDPKALASESVAIDGLAAPMHAPEAFVPVAWADKKRTWIKSACIVFEDPAR